MRLKPLCSLDMYIEMSTKESIINYTNQASFVLVRYLRQTLIVWWAFLRSHSSVWAGRDIFSRICKYAKLSDIIS